jgi:hypothetical protein
LKNVETDATLSKRMTKAENEESLDFAELWQIELLRVPRPPVSIGQISVDMTRAIDQLEEFRRAGVAATHTHQLVRAAACALAANSDLHQIVAGRRRLRPQHVDIGVTISFDATLAPGVVLQDVDHKSVPDLVNELSHRIPEIQETYRKQLAAVRRWGWLLPFGFLRRAYLRLLFARPHVRLGMAGALQITMVPMEWGATTTVLPPGVLIGGQVQSRVTVIDQKPAVRPMMNLTLSMDHGVWNGRDAARLLSAIKVHLEKGMP